MLFELDFVINILTEKIINSTNLIFEKESIAEEFKNSKDIDKRKFVEKYIIEELKACKSDNDKTLLVQKFKKFDIDWPNEIDVMRILSEHHVFYEISTFLEISDKSNEHTSSILPENSDKSNGDIIDCFAELWKIEGENLKQLAEKETDGKLQLAIISSQPAGCYHLQQAINYFSGKPVEIKLIAEPNYLPNISVLFDYFALDKFCWNFR